MNYHDICRKFDDKWRVMKKPVKIVKKKNIQKSGKSTNLNDPTPYKSVRVLPQVKDFNYTEFKKLADKTPFTQAEWAAMLHVSERTLQRYAKNNGSFAPINAERIGLIVQVITRAKKVFGSIDIFYNWIHATPPMLEGDLSFSSLTSFDGIQKVLNQIGRIEHGILA